MQGETGAAEAAEAQHTVLALLQPMDVVCREGKVCQAGSCVLQLDDASKASVSAYVHLAWPAS
jgi:hypothetical protein